MTRPCTRVARATLWIALLFASTANAWTAATFVRNDDETGPGLLQPAANDAGVALAIGCDETWRQVALLPHGPSPMTLAGGGAVSLGFRPDWITSTGRWRVRVTKDDRRRFYSHSSDVLIGRLYAEDARDAGATLYVRVQPRGADPVVIEFPLAGLRTAMDEHLWKTCGLDTYYGHLR